MSSKVRQAALLCLQKFVKVDCTSLRFNETYLLALFELTYLNCVVWEANRTVYPTNSDTRSHCSL